MTSAQIEAQPLIINPPRTTQYKQYQEYDRIYPFTTETLKDYMKDLEGKDVLAVESSDDHRLNALTLGARSVDTFDINHLTRIYSELKEEIIKHLSHQEFLDFIKNSLKYIERVKDYLKPDIKEFWQWYYLYFMHGRNSIYQTNLFYDCYPAMDYLAFNHYFSEDKYNILQKRLQTSTSRDRYYMDISLLPKAINKKYDTIYLSSIIHYRKDLLSFQKTILEIYSKLLKENGNLYYGYFYAGHHGLEEMYLRSLPTSDVIKVPSANGFGQDDILVLRK